MRVLLPLKKSNNNHIDSNSANNPTSESTSEPAAACEERTSSPLKESLAEDEEISTTSSAEVSETRFTAVSNSSASTNIASAPRLVRKRPTNSARSTTAAASCSSTATIDYSDTCVPKRIRTDSKLPAYQEQARSFDPHHSKRRSPCNINMAGGRRNAFGRQQPGDDADEQKYEEGYDDTASADLYYHQNFRLEQHREQPSPLENEPPSYENNNIYSNSNLAVLPASQSNSSSPASVVRSDNTPTENDRVAGDGITMFRRELKKRGLEIAEQAGDGNCLFRAVSLQVYGDAEQHSEVREQCLDFMAADEQHFGTFITDEKFQDYIARKRLIGVHGNNPEIQALSELFNRPVEVYTPQTGSNPLNIFHAEYKTADAPIRLSYHDGNHYNAVVDPLVPTAGLGLGLPGLQPGLADKMQVAKAVAESEETADRMELKRALKESQDDEFQRSLKESSFSRQNMYESKAIALSDLDATNLELEQVAVESSLESYKRQELGRKQRASPTAGQRGRTSPTFLASEPRTNQHAAASATLPAIGSPNSTSAASGIPPAAAAVPSVAAAAAASPPVAAMSASFPPSMEYPQVVQELAMNGFDLQKAARAYELIGDNFDDLLAYLLSSSTTTST